MTSTAKPDYWSLLGLDPGSDSEQLKRAFRMEARKWHPDLNANNVHAEERFKLINEAYAVLSDPRRRLLWENSKNIDSDLVDPFRQGFPDFNDYIQVVLGLDDVAKEVEDEGDDNEENNQNYETTSTNEWATTTARHQPPPVQTFEDIETLIELSPEEALEGSHIHLELSDGLIIEVETPPFAGDGWRLQLKGVAKGGRDHFIQLRVQTEEGLRIDGLRVLYRLELFPSDALLGCAVEIPTLSGPVTLQVPPRSSSGRLLRLRGRGLSFDDLLGDQLVEIIVVVPIDVTDAEIALYERLREIRYERE